MMRKILLWGTGKRTEYFLNKKYFENFDVVAVVDTYKKQDIFMGIPVVSLEDMLKMINDISYVLITNCFYVEIIETMLKCGIDEKKIIITDAEKYAPYIKYYDKLQQIFPQIYLDVSRMAYRRVRENEKDHMDSESIYYNCSIKASYEKDYDDDYFRYRTFEFVADEINSNEIIGEVAELGVFKGVFSSLINKKFPNRKLYLFDTFEGFDEREADREMQLGRCSEKFVNFHKDASVELVLAKMEYPENVTVCKGLFPNSVTKELEDEVFAFVSLDVDFEESTIEGLRFFYPRLAEGGYIFIHDYNTCHLGGVREAIQRYGKEIDKRLQMIPLGDRAGTLVIAK